jgi:hypothetical protein
MVHSSPISSIACEGNGRSKPQLDRGDMAAIRRKVIGYDSGGGGGVGQTAVHGAYVYRSALAILLMEGGSDDGGSVCFKVRYPGRVDQSARNWQVREPHRGRVDSLSQRHA